MSQFEKPTLLGYMEMPETELLFWPYFEYRVRIDFDDLDLLKRLWDPDFEEELSDLAVNIGFWRVETLLDEKTYKPYLKLYAQQMPHPTDMNFDRATIMATDFWRLLSMDHADSVVEFQSLGVSLIYISPDETRDESDPKDCTQQAKEYSMEFTSL